MCTGEPFDGVPLNTVVVITTHEAESAEVMAAYAYPLMIAGSDVWGVAVTEMPLGKTVAEAKKFQK